MANTHPSLPEIEAWIAGVRSDIEATNLEIAPLMEKRERLKRQLELLERLQESMDVAGGGSPVDIPSPRSVSVREYVISRAVQLLDEEAGPLHINELHARFLSRGYQVPGSGAPANITAHIRHSDLIISPKKGEYILTRHRNRRAPQSSKGRHHGES